MSLLGRERDSLKAILASYDEEEEVIVKQGGLLSPDKAKAVRIKVRGRRGGGWGVGGGVNVFRTKKICMFWTKCEVGVWKEGEGSPDLWTRIEAKITSK